MILHKIGIQSSSTLNYAEFKFLPKKRKKKLENQYNQLIIFQARITILKIIEGSMIIFKKKKIGMKQ